MSPDFSVIMPSYNSRETISAAINSVLSQTLSSFELIVVDDASSDDSCSIVENFSEFDSRVVLVRNEVNSGVAEARNCGIRLAVGRYIAFLDSDDLWRPEKLALQKEEFERGALVVFSSYKRFYDKVDDGMVVKAPSYVSFGRMMYGNCIGNLTGAYDSKLLGKFYQVNIGHEDYLMWANILRSSKEDAVGLRDVLAYYRVSEGSVSSNKIESSRWVWNIYRNYLGFGFFRSLWFFFFYCTNGVLKRV